MTLDELLKKRNSLAAARRQIELVLQPGPLKVYRPDQCFSVEQADHHAQLRNLLFKFQEDIEAQVATVNDTIARLEKQI